MTARWTDDAWADYLHWRSENRPVFKRINRLMEAIESDPFDGIGKPEPLRGELSEYWSRRITQEHRLVYKMAGKTVHVISCRYHYRK